MGSVVLSLDAELGWGFNDFEAPPTGRVESGRRGWSHMLDLLSEFDVPATWAVVGHLMLEDCDGLHAGHPSPAGWFEHERGRWADRPDLRFGPDLIGEIRASSVDHEIGSHSFSHVLFTSEGTTREVARAELRRSLELADGWDLDLETFVYPRNDVAYRGVLADHGFCCYRGRTPYREGVKGLFDTTVRNHSLLVEPYVDEYGMVDVPASLFLFGFEGRARTVVESVWDDPVVVQARQGIDRAVDSDGTFHMWLHPNNLVTERDDQRMRAILRYVDRRRAETDLQVETMGGVARRLLTASSAVDGGAVVGPSAEVPTERLD